MRNASPGGNIERQATVFAHDVVPEELRVWSRVALGWHVHLRFQLSPIYIDVFEKIIARANKRRTNVPFTQCLEIQKPMESISLTTASN